MTKGRIRMARKASAKALDPEAELQARVAVQEASDNALPVIEEPDEYEDAPVAQDQVMQPYTEDSGSMQTYRDMSEEFDHRDVTLPRIAWSHFMSKVVTRGQIQPGRWYQAQSGTDLGDTIYAIPLKAFKHRVYFRKPQAVVDQQGRPVQQGGGNVLSCRSTDMVRGQGDPGILCETCTLKDWPRGAPPPACSEVMNFPVIVIPESVALGEEPFDYDLVQVGIIPFMRTSMKSARSWLGTLFGFGAKVNPDAFAEHVFKLTINQENNAFGAYFVPIVSYAGRLTHDKHGELVGYARDMCRSMQTRGNAGMAEDVIAQEQST